MAINYNSGITSLDAGASDITYSGDQGPKSPDQQLMASADPMLVEEYNKYVFEMEEQGLQPISFKEFVQQIMSEANMAQGGIARLGYRGGQLVQPGPGRPGYQGRWSDPGMSPGTSSSGGSRGGGDPGGHHRDDPVTQSFPVYQAPTPTPSYPIDIHPPAMDVVEQAEEQAKEHNIRISPAKRELIEKAELEAYLKGMPQGSPGQLNPYVAPVTTADGPPSILNPYVPPTDMPQGPPGGGDPDMFYKAPPTTGGPPGGGDPDMFYKAPPVPPGDGGGLGDQGIMSAPVVAEEAAAGTDLAAVREDAIAEAATKSGLPFEHYYVGGDPTAEQEKFMQEHQAAASMVGREAWPAAEGGRARQRYGLGSLVKKAFKAVKKVAKSPVGMAALAAFGLPALGKFGAAQKWAGFGPKSFLSTLGSGGWKTALMGAAERGGGKLPWDRTGKAWTRAIPSLWDRIKGAGPMKTIGLLSMLPFLTQGKGEDEPSWAGNYGPGIDPEEIARKVLAGGVDPAEFRFVQPHLRAAQGGRIGYAGGGNHATRLSELIKKFNAGTITPEEENEMEQLEIMLDYGPGEAQGGRIGAQEGGLMDLGGMEKDYREEGGFVPIGGQERADDCLLYTSPSPRD